MFRKWRRVCHLRWTLFGFPGIRGALVTPKWVKQLHTNVSIDSNEKHERWLSCFWGRDGYLSNFWKWKSSMICCEFYFCMLESIVGHNVTTHSRCIHIGCVILWVGILKCGHSSLFKKVVACFVKIEMKAYDRLSMLVCCSNMRVDCTIR